MELWEDNINVIYLSLWLIFGLLIYNSKMLSKMMKDQTRVSGLGKSRKKPNKETDGETIKNNNNNKIQQSNVPVQDNKQLLPRNEQKRMKPNHNLKTEVSAHGKSITNWEKFKDIIKDADCVTSDEKKSKTNKSPISRPFSTYKRNYNTVGSSSASSSAPSSALKTAEETKENKTTEKKRNLLTKQVAMDCEMVGIGDGTDSMLARVSLVNRYGDCIYDKYVKPREKILDYRTAVSGIRPHHLHNGEEFETVQKEVAEILSGRILVGHALKHDTDVLFLSHPRRMIRDTSRYKQFRKVSKGNTPSLKKLASELLGVDIQNGEHNSVEDARTAMQLYTLYKSQWEIDIRTKR